MIWSQHYHVQIKDLEKIQKVALKIILDENDVSYDVACTLLNISPLNLTQKNQVKTIVSEIRIFCGFNTHTNHKGVTLVYMTLPKNM